MSLHGQPDTVVIGFGEYEGVSVSTSSNTSGDGENTMNLNGYLPNKNSASRFLSQTTLGYNYNDIVTVTSLGLDDWIEDQISKPVAFSLLTKAEEYRQIAGAGNGNPATGTQSRYFRLAWWQYHMTSDDVLRQRIALALSELLVISENSTFSSNGHTIADYYDIFLDDAFGNYKTILEKITYHPAMGNYLTYINNPKTDTLANIFPDENFAREIMQLFTIGTTMLNMDGTEILDIAGVPVPSYDNIDIGEFAKVFTGLTWWNASQYNQYQPNLDSWLDDMVMYENFHDPGPKNLLEGFIVPDRNPVDGKADIADAIQNVFGHSNTAPFISKFLIQRLVTANPSPDFVGRVAAVFVDNGEGVRGDMTSIIKAIFLDVEAISCSSSEDPYFGTLREPFIRYFQLNKAMEVYTTSGNYRNDMRLIYTYTGQRPMRSPSVFNFFQQDYQPIGDINDAGLVAPVFQIADAQTITGYINGLWRFIFSENIADEATVYTGEDVTDETSHINFDKYLLLTNDDQIPLMLDELNLIFAAGKITQATLDVMESMILEFPNVTSDDKLKRVKLAIYIMLSCPDYLINK